MNKTTEFRRALHQIPETGLDLPETQAYIKGQLEGLDCQIIEPFHSFVLAYFDNGKAETTALRSDMDALPLVEKTNLTFASKHEGKAHACGHDGHMSMLLAFAQKLNDFYKTLECNVLLIFQPGEESPGGAKLLADSQILDKLHVSKVYGMHLWPLIDKGTIASRPKGMMAQSNEITVSFEGKGAHAARRAQGADALLAASEFVLRCEDLSEKLSSRHILHFGKLNAGHVRNAVADKAVLEGTVRVFSKEDFCYFRDGLKKTADDIEAKYHVIISQHFSDGYPPVINDEGLYEEAKQRVPYIECLQEAPMISEDFSFYGQNFPSLFFFLGTGKETELHDPAFDFEEDVLEKGVQLYVDLIKAENK
jgi:hippurate hydrolase